MVAPDEQDPQVILIVSEADLVSDFQQHFTSRGMTIKFAEDPGAAREAVEAQRPRLVVIPVEGACLSLLQAWAEGTVPADVVIGLMTPPADVTKVPKSVSRTARRGQSREVVSLAELLLRSAPAPARAQKPVTPDKPATPNTPAASPVKKPDKPAAAGLGVGDSDKESIWNKPGGILKNLKPEKLPDEAAGPDGGGDGEEEDFDFDPSRVSDIRSLGVAVRMAKAVQDDSGSNPLPSPELKLSHSGDEPDDPDAKLAGITDAMALLPEARAAESEEETIARLARERAYAELQAADAPTTRDPTAAFPAMQPEPKFKKSRKGLIIAIVAVLLLVGGGVAAYLLFFRAKPKAAKGGKAKVAKVKKPDRPRRGLHEDHFAGTIAQLPTTVTALDVDASDEYLNRSVPELNPYMELALKRLSRKKRRKTLLERGLKLLGWERYPEARRFLKQAVDLKDGPKARAGLAGAYAGLGRNWAAIVHLRLAIKRDKKNDGYRKRLGLLYLKEDKKKKGCRALKRAAKLNKSHRAVLDKHCGKGKRKRRRRRRRRR